jgi:dolichol-phosphate mannosyltransferase
VAAREGPRTWIVLPAYNEAANLPALLHRIAAVAKAGAAIRVIVVDDGSTDDTAGAATTPAVDIVRHDRNRGLAAAVRTGLAEACRRAADHDAVVVMDADNSHPPELIPEMVRTLASGYDVVIASRFVPGGREEGVPWRRRVLSRTASRLFQVLWPTRGVRDYTTGFRAYRAGFVRRLQDAYGERMIEATGFSVMAELLLKARSLRPAVTEVPLILRYDLKKGTSKMRVARTVREYGQLVLRHLRLRTPGSRGR